MNTFIFAIVLSFYYINVPVVDMRERGDATSEVVSQGYFSEPISLLEESGDWVKIETEVDHYQGWAKKSAIVQRTEEYTPNATVNRLAAHVYTVDDTIYGPMITLPFESRIEVVETPQDPNSRWIKIALVDGHSGFIQRGDVNLFPSTISRKDLCDFSLRFMNLPYTWGGRSSFGYDCSGFVQMLFRQMGILIPRDTKDQIYWEGFNEISLDQLKPGDLIFWGLAKDKIRHVGLFIGEGKFIHAGVAENTPYIRIATLSNPDWNGSGRFAYVTARTLKETE